MSSIKLDKWTLNHLHELIEAYIPQYKDHTLLNDGNLIKYEIKPKWWARLLGRTINTDFLTVVKEIFGKMSNNQSKELFSKSFLENDKKELIDILYMLHIFAINKIDSELKQNVCQQVQHHSIDDDDSTIIYTADGPYRVTAIPIYIKQKYGVDLTIEELVQQIKNHYRV